MTAEEQQAMNEAPLSYSERMSASEVFDQYDGLDRVAAWKALTYRAFQTSRPFKAYDCAHAVAANLTHKPKDK